MANNDIIVSEMTPASQINTGDLMIMTQPDSQAETGYSTKSGTVLQVSNKMLKGTDYETDLPSFTNKNVLGGMEELKGDIFDLLPVDEASGSIANFETELALPLRSVVVDVEATGGNGTPDSPNPIVGYTEANITRCGVNLFDKTQLIEGKFYNIVNGAVVEASNANKAHTPLLKVKPSTTYYMSGFANNSYYTIIALDADKNPITYYGGASKAEPFIATLPNNCEFVYLNINIELADTTIFCESNEIIPYTPYNGQTYTVSFGQTVYGGQLIITPDRTYFHVTRRIDDLGNLNWINENDTQTGLCRANAQFTDCVWQSVMICSAYNYNPTTSYNGLSNGDIALTNSESIPLLRICNTDYSSYTNAQIKTAVTGVKLVYQTKTPFDIDLTPVQIEALLGKNNVWHDGNGDTTVKFKDSIQHYIDKKIAQTQALIL